MKLKLRYFAFLILFFNLFLFSYAQSEKKFDQLYNTTSDLVDKNEYSKAFDQALNLESIGSEENDAYKIAKANYLLAKIFKKQENYLQTIKYATTSIEFAKKAENIEYEIRSSELLAWAYVYIGFYDEATITLTKIDALLAEYKGDDKHFLLFKKLYREASLLRRKEVKPKQILQVYFQALNEIKLFKFKNNYEKNENLLSLYNNIGRTYKDVNVDSSFVYFQKAYQYKDNNDARGLADLDTNLASYYVAKNDNKKAIELLNKSIPTLIQSEHKFLTAESYKVLAEAYKNEGDTPKSTEYNTLFLTYKDSLNLKRNQSVNEAIEYVKKLDQKSDNSSQKNHIFLYISAAILLILILFFFIKLKNKK